MGAQEIVVDWRKSSEQSEGQEEYGQVEEMIADLILRLRQVQKGEPVLFMRDATFKALVTMIRATFDPLCLIIKGEPVLVCLSESVYGEKIETEGAIGWRSDIEIRFFDLGEA